MAMLMGNDTVKLLLSVHDYARDAPLVSEDFAAALGSTKAALDLVQTISCYILHMVSAPPRTVVLGLAGVSPVAHGTWWFFWVTWLRTVRHWLRLVTPGYEFTPYICPTPGGSRGFPQNARFSC